MEEPEEKDEIQYEVLDTYTTKNHKIITCRFGKSIPIGDVIAGVMLDLEEEEGVAMKFNRNLEDTGYSTDRNITIILDIDTSDGGTE